MFNTAPEPTPAILNSCSAAPNAARPSPEKRSTIARHSASASVTSPAHAVSVPTPSHSFPRAPGISLSRCVTRCCNQSQARLAEDCGPFQETSATLCSTLSFHSQTELADVEVGGGECTPSNLLVADLLPYLTVPELLNWRLLSRRTRSPEALIAHVAEMGSMDRPEAIVACSEMFTGSPDTSFDAEKEKLYRCQCWCTALASKRKTHFAEDHVHRVVGKNLQSLLRHWRSADASIASAASDILYNYTLNAIPFVQQPIAEASLALLEDLVETNIVANLDTVDACTDNLEMLLRSLSKPQCQKWVSLTVKMLLDHRLKKEEPIRTLQMLWLADDAPRQTYAEADQQLRIFAKS
ncbi:unnamed protein product, partial [Symbiodinium microadriaticum]